MMYIVIGAVCFIVGLATVIAIKAVNEAAVIIKEELYL